MPRRVYLSGGMEYATDEGRDWRLNLQAWLERELGCSVFNPNIESDRVIRTQCAGTDYRTLKTRDITAYTQIVQQLVEADCTEIATRTDFLICYWDAAAQRGAGTKGELTIARHYRKPVYLVTPFPLEEIPGWVLGCTTRIFRDFGQLQEFLTTCVHPR